MRILTENQLGVLLRKLKDLEEMVMAGGNTKRNRDMVDNISYITGILENSDEFRLTLEQVE